jgi:hypothetical protein
MFLFCAAISAMSIVAGERSTYEFLRHDVSARSSAMAGSFVSMNGDAAGMFINPASIGTVASPQALFGYTNHLLDINSGFAAYAQEMTGFGKFGIGVQYMNYGSFEQTDIFANRLGTFTAGDLALSVTVADEFEENLYYGVTAKYIYSSIAEARSSALAGDLGLLYLVPGSDPMSFGISLSNIGSQLDAYVDTKETLPFEVKIGGTIKPQHLPLQLNVNFHKLNEKRDSFFETFNAFSVGGEFTLSKALRFRFGYSNERRKELKIGTSAGMAGFSLGGGLVLKSLRLDYSYNSLGKIGSISRITLALDV